MLRCAILDDYQSCALGFADWAALSGVEVTTFTDSIAPDALAKELAGFEIIVAMRERTKFDVKLLSSLPRLKLLVTTGMRNSSIDVDAAVAGGITVCGTRGLSSPTPELTWGLLLALCRHIPTEVASVRAGEKCQTRIGVGLSGKTRWRSWASAGSADRISRFARAFEMPVLAWSRHA